MNSLGFKSVVYHGEACLGELDVIPVTDRNFQFPNNEIRIRHISPNSERCPPLSILQTVSSFSVRCKLESSSPVEQAHLINLHASCFYELQTAVVVLGDEEIHLVAMPSKQKKFPCFWCYSVPFGLYSSSLGLLNLRCLAIVFDLDETLIVANTMKSFEDRIELLRGYLARETDMVRIPWLTSELKRQAEDRALLKQYTENDWVMDNGKMSKVQMEEVPQSSDGHEKVFRPIIRLQEKNIVLTRINPEIRDTSVLVRLRPAWEDLRSYLTAKGRKRFEVYVCTMAERDYALEMWRLLDPEANLITSRQLQDRVVCVKPGGKKSLQNVFQGGTCHPKMAMVIDDRLKVWEERDQPRVHVVPAFSPYIAPQAEMANAIPVLCVARNVACNARGHFFKDFDENLLCKISDIFYEDDVANLPPGPDVSNCLIFEDSSVPNGYPSAPIAEGMRGAEVDRRLNQVTGRQAIVVATDPMKIDLELRPETSQASVTIPASASGSMPSRPFLQSQKPGLLGNPARQDLNFPEKDHDMRRRFINVRNQGPSEPPLVFRPPALMPPTAASSPHGGYSAEDDAKRARLNSRPSGLPQEFDTSKFEKLRIQNNPFASGVPGLGSSSTSTNALPMKTEEVVSGHDQQKLGVPSGSQLAEIGASQNSINSIDGTVQTEVGKLNLLASSMYIGVLQEIGRRCSSKVEFRSVVSTRHDLQFSVEVLFTGEKIGAGMGKTRKDAQQQAALNALCSLAEKYIEYASNHPAAALVDGNPSAGNENGFIWDVCSGPPQEQSKDEEMMDAASSEGGHRSDARNF